MDGLEPDDIIDEPNKNARHFVDLSRALIGSVRIPGKFADEEIADRNEERENNRVAEKNYAERERNRLNSRDHRGSPYEQAIKAAEAAILGAKIDQETRKLYFLLLPLPLGGQLAREAAEDAAYNSRRAVRLHLNGILDKQRKELDELRLSPWSPRSEQEIRESESKIETTKKELNKLTEWEIRE